VPLPQKLLMESMGYGKCITRSSVMAAYTVALSASLERVMDFAG
jgi:hypothetical protein